MTQLSFVFFGLSITSSSASAHAATYRGLVRELAARGHEVLFLERDSSCPAGSTDSSRPMPGRTAFYGSVEEACDRFGRYVRAADVVIIGSHVPEAVRLGDWVRQVASGLVAFYDIDTPSTVRGLDAGGTPYLVPRQVRRYDLYLSFTGGPLLARLSRDYGAPFIGALYGSADTEIHFPEAAPEAWDLGFLGSCGRDRRAAFDQLLLDAARTWTEGRFVAAGSHYPTDLRWPKTVERLAHPPADAHRAFYAKQRFTLNLTRQDVMVAGYSPSAGLFEAAACGTPVVSDVWPGVDRFFEPGGEILLARTSKDVLGALREMPEELRREMGQRARRRVLAEHTAGHRAETLEGYVLERLDAAARVQRPQRDSSGLYRLEPQVFVRHAPTGPQHAADPQTGDRT